MISTDKPLLLAGMSVDVSGRYSPQNPNYSTALPVTLLYYRCGGNSAIIGGPCGGGGTDLQWAQTTARNTRSAFPAFPKHRVQRNSKPRA